MSDPTNLQAELQAKRYKKIFFLQEEDVFNVHNVGEQIFNQKDAAFAEFYAWTEYQSDFTSYFTDTVLDEIEREEETTWRDLILADLDKDFISRQEQMGYKLYKMGVPFEAYLASIVAFHEIIENIITRKGLGSIEIFRSFRKITGIQMCVITDIYNSISNKTIKEQHTVLMSMSTPVTRLWKGVLFLPIVGIIDSLRAREIMAAALSEIANAQTSAFIIDISGIAVMDTAVANYLIKLTQATRLMGCTSILSGISPVVAQTIVELNINTGQLIATGNMEDALKRAFKMVGVEIHQSI
ncbi:MAG: STAS domain-containing protein [Saprospiraceae bacterium]|nr:STAS domain-containing protein [Saprospiraceae bacterium]